MHWQQNLGNQKPLYVIYGPLKENNQWSSNIPISTHPKPCMINRDIDGEFEELDEEQIQTIKFLEDLHPVSLAYNNIHIKKNAQKPKTECISRGDQTVSNGCEEKANWTNERWPGNLQGRQKLYLIFTALFLPTYNYTLKRHFVEIAQINWDTRTSSPPSRLPLASLFSSCLPLGQKSLPGTSPEHFCTSQDIPYLQTHLSVCWQQKYMGLN